jgi:hypothetical protein
MKRTWSAAAGVVAGVFTVGVATLLAALMTSAGLAGGTPSPVVAVGGAFVDRTPSWLKNFAIATFGTLDKAALFVGMALVLIAVCAVIGIVGARRPTAALVAFALLGAVGMLAVATRPSANGLDLGPVCPVAARQAGSRWQRGRPTSLPPGRRGVHRRRPDRRHPRAVPGPGSEPGG